MSWSVHIFSYKSKIKEDGILFFDTCLWGVPQAVPWCWSNTIMGQEPSPNVIQVWQACIGEEGILTADVWAVLFQYDSGPGIRHTLSCSCRSLTPSCCCLTLGPNNCPCHICCILQAAWLQPPYSEHLWPAPPEVHLKGHTVPGTLKANPLVLVNFVHLGRSKIKPTTMSQPPTREAPLQGELCNAELPSHLQKPLSLLECCCDSEKQVPNSRRNCPLG